MEILADVHGTCWQQYRRNNEVYPIPKYAHLLKPISNPSIDVKKYMEAIAIINEGRQASSKIGLIFEFCQKSMDKNTRLEEIRNYIKREKNIAHITGLISYNIISDKLFDKIIDLAQKYETGELQLLFYYTFLVLKYIESKKDCKII